MKHVIYLVLAIYATFHMVVFNDYMHDKSYRVEVVDKEMSSGTKGKTNLAIVYKREDGHVFKLSASVSEWQAATPGEKRWVSARPSDVEPTGMETLQHTVLPMAVLMFTIVYLMWFLLFYSWIPAPQEKKFVQPSTKGPFEK